jgi:predicted Zn-ribbon and HTH transcriptional regulator
MPPNWKTVYGVPFDEEKWKRAKEQAKKEGHEEDWAYVVGIYKHLARTGEYKSQYVSERKKKKQTMEDWRKKHPHWKAEARKSMRLVIASPSDNLDEFRCGTCGNLIFRGRDLHKAVIEAKCPTCKSILVSPGMLVI